MKTILLAMAATLGVATTAMADDYPNRPIRVIVPFPAGQASDTIVRLVGDQLGRRLGQPIVVENKPGAGGNLGTEQGARAAADGYTLTIATAALPISKLVYRKLAYDPVKDFDPVTLMTVTPLVLVTRPDLPVNSVKELVELARKTPGKLTFASSGLGTSHQLSSELLKALADVDILHVPYRGSAPAHLDLMSGRVDMMFDNIVPVTPHIQSGKLKALAVTTKERAPAMPGVATMAESGYASFEAVAWFGVLAPAGTPAPIVDKLSREINAVLKMPEVNAKLVSMGANVTGTSPAEFRGFMAAEINKWVPVVQRAKIVID
ncbi:tripartite tricarboxylate transporter substrate binding protein [Hydrogenophaga palleronii]|uniref:tripartite tricarboxylate transporter substrate binding protein n=1 Tax=Hydrogenophaga palleronii TaxID=65655 RepID=UPI0008265469|nr:tripartite tricarboxylate transporter substrate binding protein [Hydrogenophaga palleronii]